MSPGERGKTGARNRGGNCAGGSPSQASRKTIKSGPKQVSRTTAARPATGSRSAVSRSTAGSRTATAGSRTATAGSRTATAGSRTAASRSTGSRSTGASRPTAATRGATSPRKTKAAPKRSPSKKKASRPKAKTKTGNTAVDQQIALPSRLGIVGSNLATKRKVPTCAHYGTHIIQNNFFGWVDQTQTSLRPEPDLCNNRASLQIMTLDDLDELENGLHELDEPLEQALDQTLSTIPGQCLGLHSGLDSGLDSGVDSSAHSAVDSDVNSGVGDTDSDPRSGPNSSLGSGSQLGSDPVLRSDSQLSSHDVSGQVQKVDFAQCLNRDLIPLRNSGEIELNRSTRAVSPVSTAVNSAVNSVNELTAESIAGHKLNAETYLGAGADFKLDMFGPSSLDKMLLNWKFIASRSESTLPDEISLPGESALAGGAGGDDIGTVDDADFLTRKTIQTARAGGAWQTKRSNGDPAGAHAKKVRETVGDADRRKTFPCFNQAATLRRLQNPLHRLEKKPNGLQPVGLEAIKHADSYKPGKNSQPSQLRIQSQLGAQSQAGIQSQGAAHNKAVPRKYTLCTAENSPWFRNDFSWSERLGELNRGVFGHQSFRPLQEEALNSLLSRKDTFVLLPTGGGKSIIYQLGAVATSGVSIVVMPLISLMQDQQQFLDDSGIGCRVLQGTQGWEEVSSIYDECLSDDALKVLFITPEKISASSSLVSLVQKMYEANRLGLIAIDEAHCVSQWGNDFRPDYRKIKRLREICPSVPFLCLTASATPEVINDVCCQLALRDPQVFLTSFNRPNLRYIVHERQGTGVVEIIRLIRGKFLKSNGAACPGIIYCLSRKNCDEVAVELNRAGIRCKAYHSSVNNRETIQKQWMNDEFSVMVATIAFGMGINKKDVRFVIHLAMPNCIENYYQESGRAGRDGEVGECHLFYSPKDKSRHQMLQDANSNLAHKKTSLNGILEYCTDVKTCRRVLLMAHFGQHFDKSNCLLKCDNCATTKSVSTRVCGAQVNRIIDIIAALNVKNTRSWSPDLTLIDLRNILLGHKIKKLQFFEAQLKECQGFGYMKQQGWNESDTQSLLQKMISCKVLGEKVKKLPNKGVATYIYPGPQAFNGARLLNTIELLGKGESDGANAPLGTALHNEPDYFS
ncbi:ATP-dependent DNA helicase, RecQ family protein [Gregarina niphandrodes]|uniref:DNA 3'-5' helicase n=1 Tax=Gregarina niphandrodes TaxID=110365 RepID=A0A023B712_GRENI|nr:ATP-dependent DNA helicase, RecQ family protein [Gregarina niphandrodes]EZG66951.1 ATP-dependent DNA helicase, RecQ family protein [Gregarina niphandrodes]|eukprot:XP_011130410.1 ATP-dependent DNA helicase, RecQ family protein [Gregarina niphandrodes]